MHIPNEPDEINAELNSFTKKKLEEILDGAYINRHTDKHFYYLDKSPIKPQYDQLYEHHYGMNSNVTFSDFEKAYRSTIDLEIDLKNFIDDNMDMTFSHAVVSARAPLLTDRVGRVLMGGVSEGVYSSIDIHSMSYRQLCIAMDKMADFSVVCDSLTPLCTEIKLPMADHDGDSNIFRKLVAQYESYRPYSKNHYYSKKSGDNCLPIPKTVSAKVNNLLARSQKD